MTTENTLEKKDYRTSITVNSNAAEVFKKIMAISEWWSENLEGRAQALQDSFTVRFGETWITIKVTELIPDKKIVWLVTDYNKPWLKNKKEWRGTIINWEIFSMKSKTQLIFTHNGLTQDMECFKECEKGWNFFIHESLHGLLTSDKGLPEKKEN